MVCCVIIIAISLPCGSRSSPVYSEFGCQKIEILVPWKNVFAVVAAGLWSTSSITDVVDNPFLENGGQTTLSSTG